MLDELLTEVDSEDRVIGPRARGEIHRLGLRHRSVHILVFNPRGELFLQSGLGPGMALRQRVDRALGGRVAGQAVVGVDVGDHLH